MTSIPALSDPLTQLTAFRRLHAPRKRDVAGIAFQYHIVEPAFEAGGPAVMILPGLLGVAEMSFQLMTALGHSHRVIVPSYPRAVDSVDRLLRGMVAILDGEGVARVAVVGASFGGLLAQRFATHYPDRVTHLVLADTSVARPERAATNRRAARIFAWLPSGVVRWLLRGLCRRSLAQDDNTGFWTRYTADVVAGLDAVDLASRYCVAADLDAGPILDGSSFAVRTLLVESDDDPIVQKAAAHALRQKFVGAARYVFHKGGHAPAIRYPQQYAEIVSAFLHSAGEVSPPASGHRRASAAGGAGARDSKGA